MDESNMERNAIVLFEACTRMKPPRTCREIVFAYLDEKSRAMSSYFGHMEKEAIIAGEMLKAAEYKLRSEAAVEAANRMKRLIGGIVP